MNARDFGFPDDPYAAAEEDVKPYRGLSPRERYAAFLDLMSFLEKIWKSLDPRKRAHYERVDDELNDPGRWWERVPPARPKPAATAGRRPGSPVRYGETQPLGQ